VLPPRYGSPVTDLAPKRPLFPILAGAVVAAALGGAAAFALWPEPPVVKPDAPKGDTGMTDEQKEQMMRTIGYVQ
jgi:hypothetical protein